MNLAKKKILAAKTLGVGKHRIIFDTARLNEIKEAITKDDVRSLHKEGVISIKQVGGRKKVERRTRRRGPGKVRMKVNKRKKLYVIITRKLRGYVADLKNKEVITKDLYWDLRNKIRMRDFKSKASLRDYLVGMGIAVGGNKGKDTKLKKKTKTENKLVKKSAKTKTESKK